MLLDTSFLVAYLDSRDQNHKSASALIKELESGKYGALFISEYAFDELMTVLRKHIGHKRTVLSGQHILDSIELVGIEQAVFRFAWELFKKHEKLSFTDCYQAALIKHLDIGYIATFDSDFNHIVKVLP